MKKRCTESRCRRVFTVRGSVPECPYCGRKYSRLNGPVIHWILMVSEFPENERRACLKLAIHTPLDLAGARNAVRIGRARIPFDTQKDAEKAAGTLRDAGFRVVINHSYE